MKILKKNYFQAFILFIVLVVIAFINGTIFIFGDGYGYFHVAKSLETNGTFISKTEPEYFPYSGHTVSEYKGNFVTAYQPGNAILWWPFLKVASAFYQGTIYDNYYIAFNGHSFADGFAILFASIIYSYITVLLLILILTDLGFSKKNSIFSILIAYLSSYLFAYIFQYPAYSHVYELFALTGLLFSIIRFGKLFRYKYMIMAGIFGGLLVLTRPVNAVILAPILFYNLRARNFKANLYLILSGIPFAIIFLLYNYSSYQCFLCSGQSVLWGGEFDFKNINTVKLLFSEIRGLFFYSPALFFGFLAIIAYARKTFNSILIYVLPIILTIALYSFWPNWWAGDSIGQRFFLVLLPFFTIGIAFTIKKIKSNKIKKLYIILLSLLTFYSTFVLILYRVTPTASLYQFNQITANNYPEVTKEERFSSLDIINYNLQSISEKGIIGYFKNLPNFLNGGRSLLLLALGKTDPIVKLKSLSESQFELHIIPSNLNNKLTGKLFVVVNYLENLQTYEIDGIDFSQYKVIKVECDKEICSFANEIIKVDQFASTLNFLKLSTQLKVSLSSDINVKFVDYKIKNK